MSSTFMRAPPASAPLLPRFWRRGWLALMMILILALSGGGVWWVARCDIAAHAAISASAR